MASKSLILGSNLAELSANQIKEKCDWALTPGLRSVGYASRQFDEPGAHEAAKESLASDPSANLQWHLN